MPDHPGNVRFWRKAIGLTISWRCVDGEMKCRAVLAARIAAGKDVAMYVGEA